jgi:hypothetical protein
MRIEFDDKMHCPLETKFPANDMLLIYKQINAANATSHQDTSMGSSWINHLITFSLGMG